jgi:hypothetical protein
MKMNDDKENDCASEANASTDDRVAACSRLLSLAGYAPAELSTDMQVRRSVLLQGADGLTHLTRCVAVDSFCQSVTITRLYAHGNRRSSGQRVALGTKVSAHMWMFAPILFVQSVHPWRQR